MLTKHIPLAHKYMTVHETYTPSTLIHDCSLSCLGTSISIKIGGLNKFYRVKPPLLVKWCGHARIFHMWVKCQPLHVAGDFFKCNPLFRKQTIFQSNSRKHFVMHQSISFLVVNICINKLYCMLRYLTIYQSCLYLPYLCLLA